MTTPKSSKKKPQTARELPSRAKEGAPVLAKTPTHNKSKARAKPHLKPRPENKRGNIQQKIKGSTKSVASNKQRSKAKKLKPGTAAYAARMRELGLVEPLPIAGRQTRFKKEQRKAYAKLKRSGFDDIEWVDHRTGLGHNSDYLKRSASMGRAWRPEKAEFFRLLRNFVAHYEFRTKRDRIAMELLAEGKSFRKILAHLRNKCGYTKSLYSLFYYIHELLKQCQKFNIEHKEGLLNPANADSFADDALMADLHMQNCHLGLPVDAGWFDENLSQYYDRANSN